MSNKNNNTPKTNNSKKGLDTLGRLVKTEDGSPILVPGVKPKGTTISYPGRTYLK